MVQELKRPEIPNIIADRYASTPLLLVFAPKNKILQERELWITIMKGQEE